MRRHHIVTDPSLPFAQKWKIACCAYRAIRILLWSRGPVEITIEDGRVEVKRCKPNRPSQPNRP